ncbi:MAG: RsmD family RNA methyltransferase [Aquificaceae bacterium]|nr:RsmD family RNA methyltransferase [Aquificaceae bacterium]MDW8237594.1 RsmD family RNA methyltransferase [Aquificaceae bacterium]
MKKARQKQGFRPTTSAVKSALFNMLGDISQKRFLDLFAGSGQIGKEAILRGAQVLFVEKNKTLGAKLRQEFGNAVVISDAISFLQQSQVRWDIIFADPPYEFERYATLTKVAVESLNEGGIFVLEHSKKSVFECDKRKEYGDSALSLWVR